MSGPYTGIGGLHHWEACRYPERVPTADTRYEVGCRACMVALEVAVNVEPPDGAFDGWYRRREDVVAQLAAQGVELHLRD